MIHQRPGLKIGGGEKRDEDVMEECERGCRVLCCVVFSKQTKVLDGVSVHARSPSPSPSLSLPTLESFDDLCDESVSESRLCFLGVIESNLQCSESVHDVVVFVVLKEFRESGVDD
jgi:hypothetical protein